jgi:hypothetical protein
MPITHSKIFGFALLLIIVSGSFAFSQTNTQHIKSFSGKVIDSINGKAVPYAYIYNGTRKLSTQANSNGLFVVLAKVGDTLAITSMGYLGKVYKIKLSDTSNMLRIRLSQQVYEIEAVKVRFPATYQDFKREFLNLKVPNSSPIEGLPTHNPYKTPYLLDTNIIQSANFAFNHPISALYSKYSREEQSKRQVWYLKQQELRQAAVDKKYNKQLVQEITGFKDDDLINFMGYCNFNFNYLYESTPLEIVEAIYNKYDAFIQCCYKKTDTKNKLP